MVFLSRAGDFEEFYGNLFNSPGVTGAHRRYERCTYVVSLWRFDEPRRVDSRVLNAFWYKPIVRRQNSPVTIYVGDWSRALRNGEQDMFKRIADILELRTSQLSKLAITATIGRAEEMLNGPIKSSCRAKRNIRHDPAVCLVGTVEQSVDLTWTCRYEVRAHPYAAERRLQSANKTMAKQQTLGPQRNLTIKNANTIKLLYLPQR